MAKPKFCINASDDRNHQKRPSPHPGPRCATCWGVEEKRRKQARHRTYVSKTYGVPTDFYDKLYEYQDGKCALCRWATGATKRLANDHNHKCCKEPPLCGQCVRGLLCGPCNEIIGRWGDDPDIFLRGFRYLLDPPAKQLMKLLGLIDDDRTGTTGVTGRVGSMAAQSGSQPVHFSAQHG